MAQYLELKYFVWQTALGEQFFQNEVSFDSKYAPKYLRSKQGVVEGFNKFPPPSPGKSRKWMILAEWSCLFLFDLSILIIRHFGG